MSNLVAIPCQYKWAAFSGERLFKLVLSNGESYIGVSSNNFLWNFLGGLVRDEQPLDYVDGMLAVRVIQYIDEDEVLVVLPDTEQVVVEKVFPRPTPITPPGKPS